MKSIRLCLLICGAALPECGFAQEADIAATGIPGPIADGSQPPAMPLPAPIAFSVLNSVTKNVQVEEPSEISDLPPITGTAKSTIQLVADPGLAEPPPPLPALPLEDPAVQARLSEARSNFSECKILFVSAQVIDRQKTILKCYPNGKLGEEVTVVSNLDFNDFSGFGCFNVAGQGGDGAEEIRQYALIMALDNQSAEGQQQPPPDAVEWPQAPAEGEPAYVVAEGSNEEALQAIEDMHSLYRVEGQRMNAARIAREVALEDRRAYLLANPPKPQDVTIKFWRRK